MLPVRETMLVGSKGLREIDHILGEQLNPGYSFASSEARPSYSSSGCDWTEKQSHALYDHSD